MGEDVLHGNLVVAEALHIACKLFLEAKAPVNPNNADNARAFYAAAVLASGQDARLIPYINTERQRNYAETTDPTWEYYVRLGIHPVDARNAWLPICVRLAAVEAWDGNELIGHPLNLAVMFAKFMKDRPAAEKCVAAYHQITAGMNDANYREARYGVNGNTNPWYDGRLYRYTDRYQNYGFWTDSWTCPDPRAHGLGDLTLKNTDNGFPFFAYPLIAWFDKEPASTLAASPQWTSSKGLRPLARALCISGVDHTKEVMASAAEKVLKERWEDVRPDYDLLTSALRFVDKDTADEYIKNATGAKAVLGIVRSNATRDQMGKGLSALAQMHKEQIQLLSAFFGRAPTVVELCGLRAKRLVDVLYYLPAPFLREALDEEDGAERLRARVLREVSTADPTVLRGLLSDHSKRAALADYPLLNKVTPARVAATPFCDDQWDAVYGELAKRYMASCDYRNKMKALVPNDTVRAAAILALTTHQDSPLLSILAKLPNWDQVQNITTEFMPMFRPSEKLGGL